MKTMPQSKESRFKLNSASFDVKHDINCDVFPAKRRRELNWETGFDRNTDSGCNAIMLYVAPSIFIWDCRDGFETIDCFDIIMTK
jgi:hypothetical protein